MLILLVLALLFSLPLLIRRDAIEGDNNQVELAFDYRSLEKLIDTHDLDREELFNHLEATGITSLALTDTDLNYLMQEGQVIGSTGRRLRELSLITGQKHPLLQDRDFHFDEDLFLFVPSPSVLSFVQEGLKIRLEEEPLLLEDEDFSILYLEEIPDDLISLPLGFELERGELEDYGLRLLPRLKNHDLYTADNLEAVWRDSIPFEQSTIVFAGSEAFGHDLDLELTARLMEEGDHYLGVIEPFLAVQEGVFELARGLEKRVIRVHSLQQGEMEILPAERIISRYIRAIRERNVRFLYLRPIIEEAGDYPLESNITLIQQLVDRLLEEGYSLGPAEPFFPLSLSTPMLLFLNLGVWAALILFLSQFIRKKGLLIYLLFSGILLSIISLVAGYSLLNRQAMALLAAIIFPTWGVLTLYHSLIKKPQDNFDYWSLWRKSLRALLQATLFSLAGAVIIAGLLSDLTFLMQIEYFRGIKLAFILPLFLITGALLFHQGGINIRSPQDLLKALKAPFRFFHLGLLLVIPLGIFIYLARTGNFPLVPVPRLEIWFREFLESVLLVRPRFKEFLLGHPLLMLLLLVRGWKRFWILPLLVLGSIGQLSIVNSFAHLHTPLRISLLRVGGGLLLGVLLGSLLLFVLFNLQARWGPIKRGIEGQG